jgi:hypothetical protein
MISPGKRWFLYRSVFAAGVMSAPIWGARGCWKGIAEVIMSWGRMDGQQLDNAARGRKAPQRMAL